MVGDRAAGGMKVGGDDGNTRTAWLRAAKLWHPKVLGFGLISALAPCLSLCLGFSVVKTCRTNHRNAHKQGNNEGDRGA